MNINHKLAPKTVKEDFLHFVWQYQYFQDALNLHSSNGQKIEVLHPGYANADAGADFQMAKLRIDGIEWNGSVEIHINASDWHQHKHQHDQAYNNVVLHVVWQNDRAITHQDQSIIPTLELEDKVAPDLLQRYQQWLSDNSVILCRKQLSQVSSIHKLMMLDKALSQRLLRKASGILGLYEINEKDWESTTYQWLGRGFGFKINTEAFVELTRCLPLRYLQKHRDNILSVEALIFGQAGLLSTPPQKADNYWYQLQREYHFLQSKYQLEPIPAVLWKRARLRPPNFPTVRLAQFASLLQNLPHLFNRLSQSEVKELKDLLKVSPSKYWQTHYDFGKTSKQPIKGLGKSAIDNLLINVVAPLLAARAKQEDAQQYMEAALALLEQLPAEENKIIRQWAEHNFSVKTAFDSQALIELYRQFCEKRKCLSCHIGQKLLNISPKKYKN